MIHQLKIYPTFFKDIIYNKKRFEVRYNDRNYQVGDFLSLQEYDGTCYSGSTIIVRVDYILSDFVGLTDNYVVLGFSFVR